MSLSLKSRLSADRLHQSLAQILFGVGDDDTSGLRREFENVMRAADSVECPVIGLKVSNQVYTLHLHTIHKSV